MIIVDCKICNKKFSVKPSILKRGYGKYCSVSCGRRGNRKGKNVRCFICGTITYRARGKLNRSISKKYFCSKSCQAIWKNSNRIGENHPNWKHGKSSYRHVLNRHKILKICTLCKTDDVRILAVHHVDKNRQNNNVENLAWLCHNCHFLVHHDSVDRQRFLDRLSKR